MMHAAIIGGGVVFVLGGFATAAAIGTRSWPQAALAGAVAATGLAVCVSADRSIERRRKEDRTAAIEAATATGGHYEVRMRWNRWLLQLGGAVATAALGCAGAVVAWHAGERMLAVGSGLLIPGGFLAFLVLLGTGLPASRAGHFLRMDGHGLFHFGKGYIPWKRVIAVDLMRQPSSQSWKWRRTAYDYFLVVSLREGSASVQRVRPVRFLGDPHATSFNLPGCVVLPLEYAADEPLAVLAAARAIAGRAGVPVPQGVDIRPLDGTQQRPDVFHRGWPHATVVVACTVLVIYLAAWLARGSP